MTEPAPGFDAARFKALERAGFNRISQRYHATADSRQAVADAVLATAALQPGETVLDLASGPGLLALPAARAVGTHGRVIATDIADGMLAIAQHHAPAELTEHMLYAACDAEHLCLADASCDVILAGLALFMFPHAGRALDEARRVARPHARLVLSVWGEAADVPLLRCAQDTLARELPPSKVTRPSVFRFGQPAVLDETLTAHGWRLDSLTACDFISEFGDADAYWQAFLDLAGGVAQAVSRLPEATQQHLRNAVAHDLEPWRAANGYAVPARTWVASARPQ